MDRYLALFVSLFIIFLIHQPPIGRSSSFFPMLRSSCPVDTQMWGEMLTWETSADGSTLLTPSFTLHTNLRRYGACKRQHRPARFTHVFALCLWNMDFLQPTPRLPWAWVMAFHILWCTIYHPRMLCCVLRSQCGWYILLWKPWLWHTQGIPASYCQCTCVLTRESGGRCDRGIPGVCEA